MMRSTFVHLPGIGLKTEQRLWQIGLRDWKDLRAIPLGQRRDIAACLDESERALSEEDANFFL